MVGASRLFEDRRAHVRLRPIDLDRPVLARLKYGPMLTLIDVSAGGALIETPARLTPGAHVLLEFLAPGTQQAIIVPSRIIRSHVAALGHRVRYRGACSFKQLLKLAEFMARGPRRVDQRSAESREADPSLKSIVEARVPDLDMPTAFTLTQALHHLRPLLAEPAGAIDARVAALLDDMAGMARRSESPRVLMAHVDEWLRRHVPLLTLRIKAAAAERAVATGSLSFHVRASGRGGGRRVNVEFRPACTLDDAQVRLLEAGAHVMSVLYAWR